MDKKVKTIVSTAVIAVIGAILPVLAALLVYGSSANSFVISNYIFIVGILTAVSGGIWTILPFFVLKSKRKKALDIFFEDYYAGEFDVSKKDYFGLLEIKTGSEYAKSDWKDENVPDSYMVQFYHYMNILGLSWGFFAALLGGNQYKEVELLDNKEIQDNILKAEESFWHEYIEKNVTPPVTANDKENLFRLYPHQVPGKGVVLNNLEDIFLKRQEWSESVKAAQEKVAYYENLIKDRMKDAETAMIGPHKVTWKVQHKDSYTIKATDTRVMRFTEYKEDK